MSNYTKLPDPILKKIIGLLSNDFDEEGIDIDDDYQVFDDDSLDIISSTLKYFGIECEEQEDYSYFIALLRLNPFYETRPINRPKLEKYNVLHSEDAYMYKTTTFNNVVSSYIPVTESMIGKLEEQDWYVYHDGEVVDEQYDDYQVNDVRIDNIIKIPQNPNK